MLKTSSQSNTTFVEQKGDMIGASRPGVMSGSSHISFLLCKQNKSSHKPIPFTFHNDLTPTQIKDAFPEYEQYAKKELTRYKSELKKLIQETHHRIKHIYAEQTGDVQWCYLAIERHLYTETKQNILRHINRLERLLPPTKQHPYHVTDQEIERARNYSIKELLLEYGIVVKRKTAICPFHPDKNPSMSVSKNRFYCFGCGAKGDTIEMVRKMEHKSFYQAIKKLL